MPRGIPSQARTNVPSVAPSQYFEPMEQQIGQDAPRVMKSIGPASEALEPAYIQVVDRPVDNEKVAMLAFMNEPVTVHIHTTTDPQAAQVFDLCNGGDRMFFRRGETKTVKRKFVDILATRKLTNYTQNRVKNARGEMEDVQEPHSALMYPFSVVEDRNPRGNSWLQFALAQY